MDPYVTHLKWEKSQLIVVFQMEKHIYATRSFVQKITCLEEKQTLTSVAIKIRHDDLVSRIFIENLGN